jgi:phosphoribosyl 1,2-cyclic phosphodiesterase
MRLTFLGTHALTETRSARHALNSALLVREGKTRVLVDCGSDWLGRITEIDPQAIVITHAHSDHADGLKEGAPCPVFATEKTWRSLQDYPIRERQIILPGVPIQIGDLTVEAVPLHHSERAPSIGCRISSAAGSIFYSSDVALLPDPRTSLRNVQLYIGDGSSYRVPLLRSGEDGPLGHASVATQLEWCANAKVTRTVFTHCGEELIGDQAIGFAEEIQVLGEKLGVETLIAWDGMELKLG